jgi:hypothetical protein
MQRYYFHIRTGAELEQDREGAEFPSVDAARREAIQAAREILAERLLAGEAIDGEAIDGEAFEITTREGAVIEVMPFKSVIRMI